MRKHTPVAVRCVELSQPLQSLEDVRDYARVRVYVTRDGHLLGYVEIANQRQPVSAARLRQAIADGLSLKVLNRNHNLSETFLWAEAVVRLMEHHVSVENHWPLVSESDVPTIPQPSEYKRIDLSQPLQPLTDVLSHSRVRVDVTWKNRHLGYVTIDNYHQPITTARLRQAIVSQLNINLFEPEGLLYKYAAWTTAVTTLARHYLPRQTKSESLPTHVTVSIVIATLDRPNDLRECLRTLVAQVSPRRIEIVVVDNNPDSGLTPPVIREFLGVLLVNEPRHGLAYARNAGFVASTGDILIATDDDVLAPPDWVERLVAPFVNHEVMIATGNVLPFELETPSQQYYETYGGLGRGFQQLKFSADWFEWFRFKAVPTWRLGATANAAFRASIFAHPEIGLMDEALGPGMPSGVGEDTYVFYKVLKAGYTIAYEPEAYVWHKHRRTMDALRRQLYSYSKGGVAYNLTTFLKDGDWRGLFRVLVELPIGYLWRINEWLQGRIDYPMSLLLLEMRGNLAGFWALWQSWQRVKREGRSAPYVPASQRGSLSSHPRAPQLLSLETLASEPGSVMDD